MQIIPEIGIREFKKIDLKGANVIDGFSSVSPINAIAATYLVSSLNLDQIAALDSEDFPPISMIYDSKPKFPARIYARSDLAAFVAEFAPHPRLFRCIARAMIEWTKQQQCARIVAAVGIPDITKGAASEIYSVATTEQARELLSRVGIPQIRVGIIPGLAGVLLNEGRWNQLEVIALVAPIREGMPDAKAAARILEMMAKLLPNLTMDLTPLYQEAERIESALKTLRQQTKPMEDSISRVYG